MNKLPRTWSKYWLSLTCSAYDPSAGRSRTLEVSLFGSMYLAFTSCPSMCTADHISAKISPAFLKLSFSRLTSTVRVLPLESRCDPKESWERIIPVSSRLSGTMRLSTLLIALLPGALVTMNIASRSYFLKCSMACAITLRYRGFSLGPPSLEMIRTCNFRGSWLARRYVIK